MAMDCNSCGALCGRKKKESKAGLLKNTSSRVGRVLKQNKIKDADNSTRKRKV